MVWAAEHDWAVRIENYFFGKRTLVVHGQDGPCTWIGSFEQLKAWAGY